VKAARLVTILWFGLIATTSCSRTHADPQQSSGTTADAPNSAGSSQESTDPQTADLIARVKDMSASKLEKGLPEVRFEDWVRENAGSDWAITWGFSRSDEVQSSGFKFSGSVDARGDAKDGQYFRLSIGTATNANQVLLFWHSGAVNIHNKWIGLEHLSQLPQLLHHASEGPHTSKGQNEERK
jgi:hypothetical protein